MKKIYKTFILTVLLVTTMLAAAQAQALEDVINSIRSGNIPAISKYFDKFVTITIANNQSAYSKSQAEMVLKDFFSKNPIKEFTVLQQGATTGNDSKFAIGKMTTSNGVYQLYIVLKHKSDNYILQEIRFER